MRLSAALAHKPKKEKLNPLKGKPMKPSMKADQGFIITQKPIEKGKAWLPSDEELEAFMVKLERMYT